MNIKKIYDAFKVHEKSERKERHIIRIAPQKGENPDKPKPPLVKEKTMNLTDREWYLFLTKLEIEGKNVRSFGDCVAMIGCYEGSWSW